MLIYFILLVFIFFCAYFRNFFRCCCWFFFIFFLYNIFFCWRNLEVSFFFVFIISKEVLAIKCFLKLYIKKIWNQILIGLTKCVKNKTKYLFEVPRPKERQTDRKATWSVTETDIMDIDTQLYQIVHVFSRLSSL